MLIGIVATIGVGIRRWQQRRHQDPPAASVGDLAMFLLGMVLLGLALTGPLDVLSRRLMSAHMIQHLLLISAVPALLLPSALALRPRAAAVRITPALAGGCLVASLVLIWALHVPAVLEAGLRSPAVGDLEHLALLAAGGLLTWPLVGRDRVAGMAAVAFLVVAEIGLGALGIVLAWSPQILYGFYEAAPRTFGLTARDDQALAGAFLLVVEEPFLAVEFAVLFIGGVLSQTGDE